MTSRTFAFALLALGFMLTACSEFSVITDLDRIRKISEFKKVGVLMRTGHHRDIQHGDYKNNIRNWLEGYKKLVVIDLIDNESETISFFKNETDRFYQLASRRNIMENVDKTFLKYKALGIINLYMQGNSAELKKLIADNKLDALLIYEVYCTISTEMQFYDFDSVIAIVDRDLNIVYLDHQTNSFDSIEADKNKIKEELLNKISNRLVDRFLRLDFIERIRLR
jgi:hypothetical protein